MPRGVAQVARGWAVVRAVSGDIGNRGDPVHLRIMPAPDPKRLRRATACAVVFDAQGRLLLHRRTDNGRWALPGGAIETGETAEESIVREVWEETGYRVVVTRLIGVYSQPAQTTITYPGGDVVAYVSLSFECTVTGGAPALSDETSAVDWFDPRALPEPFHGTHVQRVEDAVARNPIAFSR
jgi:8-oxo-dGTP pyrophosphatase MutT (NUDIX family)